MKAGRKIFYMPYPKRQKNQKSNKKVVKGLVKKYGLDFRDSIGCEFDKQVVKVAVKQHEKKLCTHKIR